MVTVVVVRGAVLAAQTQTRASDLGRGAVQGRASRAVDQLSQTGQELGVTGAAGTNPEAPQSEERGQDGVNIKRAKTPLALHDMIWHQYVMIP